MIISKDLINEAKEKISEVFGEEIKKVENKSLILSDNKDYTILVVDDQYILIDKTKVNIGKIKIKNKNIEKNTCYVELTIVEGRNHIIKRLFQSLGYTVLKLTRIKIGHLSIDNLQSGEYRKLKIKEVKRFYGK